MAQKAELKTEPLLRGITGARWHLSGSDLETVALLEKATRVSRPVLQCLANRGINTPAAVEIFLKPDFDLHRHSPDLLRDMRLVVERLTSAVRNGEKILVVTDFDVDGTTSSVILSTVLRLMGAARGQVDCYVPDRFTEGYGLSTRIVEQASEQGFQVILTADIGIKSHQEARRAKELGIDLIICDHHLPDGEDVPGDAFAVLCPKGSSGTGYPNKDLAACGVALKLAEALLASHPRSNELISSLSKLTAIGSIADMVDVSNPENRSIIAHGLRELGKPSANHGLKALLEVSQIKAPVSTYDIGFKIGPRINAAGRISHANTVLSLFSASTAEEARALADQLDQLNIERQQIQQTLVARILESLEEGLSGDKVLVFAGPESEGYHRGVVGIVCSKLVERTGRPVLTCAINEEGMAHGSARSIQGFHIVEALGSCADLLVKFGGHPMAAGFTLRGSDIDEFRRQINRYAEGVLSNEMLGRVLQIDGELSISELTPQLVSDLALLEPFGIGNPAPQFLLRKQKARTVAILKEKHLKLQLGPAGKGVDALWWNAAEYYETLSRAEYLDLVIKPEINEWNGRRTVQLKVTDISVTQN